MGFSCRDSGKFHHGSRFSVFYLLILLFLVIHSIKIEMIYFVYFLNYNIQPRINISSFHIIYNIFCKKGEETFNIKRAMCFQGEKIHGDHMENCGRKITGNIEFNGKLWGK